MKRNTIFQERSAPLHFLQHPPLVFVMSASPPSVPFWGPVTANYDWCESNYVISTYVAEFWNALSSVPTLTVGLWFALKSHKHGYGFRFSLAGWMLAVVGSGSCAFHGTLTRLGQIADELPMLYSSSIFLWIAASLRFKVNKDGDEKSKRLGYGLLLYCVAITTAYLNGGFELFFVAYASTVLAVAVTSLSAVNESPSKKTTKPYVLYAFGVYVGGFLGAVLYFPNPTTVCPCKTDTFFYLSQRCGFRSRCFAGTNCITHTVTATTTPHYRTCHCRCTRSSTSHRQLGRFLG